MAVRLAALALGQAVVALAHSHGGDHWSYVFSFSAYPGYTGSLAAAGYMAVKSMEDDGAMLQHLYWTLTGLDDRCSEACTAANCCGVHIHEGMTCSDASAIGGHYWNSTTYTEDPWQTIMYNTSMGYPAVTASPIAVITGTSQMDILGRAMVIHDYEGGRIACGIIETATQSAFEKYPGFTGTLVEGGFKIETTDDTQTLHGIFTAGLDASCSMPCTAPNCCGVHIHEGKTCDDASVIGGHWWNKTLENDDPWAYIMYNTTSDPAGMMAEVMTYLPYEEIQGRSLVIHDFTGARIACALIELPSTTTTTVATTTADTTAISSVPRGAAQTAVAVALVAGWLFMSES
mmetsp:Transcript_62154/g.116269  ORF Transcript_62154/g.116269 Transcript_62154/m.116269 type:complete len:346 (+) Transcript_62154:65-1102(+)